MGFFVVKENVMLTWILEKDIFDESYFNDFINYFNNNDICYHVIRIVPFIHKIEGYIPNPEGNVIGYGSMCIPFVFKENNWNGVWCSDCLSEMNVMKGYGKDYLNHDQHRMLMKDVSDYIKDVDEFFIKPDGDTKEFAGLVMKSSHYNDWLEDLLKIGYLEHINFYVVVSVPKQIKNEWRIVVVDGKISDFSIYRQNGHLKPERKITQEVVNFTKDMIKKYNPLDVYVIDISETPDGYKVIELNCFNSAGLYKCCVDNIIKDVNVFMDKGCI